MKTNNSLTQCPIQQILLLTPIKYLNFAVIEEVVFVVYFFKYLKEAMGLKGRSCASIK
jgi:uncharacterized membrane protein